MRDFGRVRRTPEEKKRITNRIHLVQAGVIFVTLAVSLSLIALPYLRR